jgi:hypothetical protein
MNDREEKMEEGNMCRSQQFTRAEEMVQPL